MVKTDSSFKLYKTTKDWNIVQLLENKIFISLYHKSDSYSICDRLFVCLFVSLLSHFWLIHLFYLLLLYQPYVITDCYFSSLLSSKALYYWPFMTGGFAERVAISWRHHVFTIVTNHPSSFMRPTIIFLPGAIVAINKPHFVSVAYHVIHPDVTKFITKCRSRSGFTTLIP